MMSNLVRLARPLFGAVCIVMASASCGGAGPATVAPRAPSATEAAWVTAVLGAPPSASLFVRPIAIRGDAYWGPLVGRVLGGRDRAGDFISHWSGGMILNARQIDMHFSVRDPIAYRQKSAKSDPRSLGWLGVIHGLAPMDPLAMRSGAGRPMFAPPWRLPSGVTMYPPDQAYAAEYGEFSPTLFIMPNGTVVVTEQVSAPRAHGFFSANNAPSPPLEAAPAALAGVTVGITSMRFLNVGKHDQTALLQGATSAAFGVRGGTNGAVEGYADYTTSDDAERGYAALQRTCAGRADGCILDPTMFKDAQADRDGKRITISLAFTDSLLNSVRDATLGQ